MTAAGRPFPVESVTRPVTTAGDCALTRDAPPIVMITKEHAAKTNPRGHSEKRWWGAVDIVVSDRYASQHIYRGISDR